MFSLTAALFLLHAFSKTASTCPSPCTCFGDTMRCVDSNITDIRFARVPSNVRLLDIRQNSELNRLERDSFMRYQNVRILLLISNAIEYVHPEALKPLKKVEYIYLQGNNIKRIPKGLLKYQGKLRLLSLFRNKISFIENGAFYKVTKLSTLYLHNNRLQSVDQGLFKTTIHLNQLRLDANPLHCNCSLLWLRTYQPAQTQIGPACTTPAQLRNKKIATLEPEDLNCRPPVIHESVSQVSVSQGDPVTIDCNYEGYPEPEVKWLHNNIEVSFSDKYIKMDNGSLYITSMDAEDKGTYTCTVTNVFGSVKTDVSLTFLGDLAAPEIVAASTNITATVGSTAILSIKVRANPKAEITWTRNGERLPQNGRFLSEGDFYKLRIFDVELTDAGVYTCFVSNSLGSASTDIVVVVIAAPVVVGVTSNVTALVGGDIRLKCKYSGEVSPLIIWIKDRVQLESDERITISQEEGLLEVKQVTLRDSGLYTCRVVTDLSSVSYSARVTVRVSRPPVIFEPPQETFTAVGSDFTLTCRARMVDQYFWEFQGNRLESSNRMQFFSNGETLVVSNVLDSDEGRYTCLAVNTDGQSEASALVSVIGDLISCEGIITVEELGAIRRDIDTAYRQTKERLVAALQNHTASPSKLLLLLKFPTEGTIELSMAAEVFEEALQRIETNSSMNFQTLSRNQTVLSDCEIEVLGTLSGCRAPKETKSCSDFCFHSKYRSYDGTCNNLQHPYYGSAGMALNRLMDADYENGINIPHGWSQANYGDPFSPPRPSTRLISTSVLSSSNSTPNQQHTLMLMQFGQFLDHDIDFAPVVPSDSPFRNASKCEDTCRNEPPCFPIPISPNDTRIRNKNCMSFTRSSAVCGTGSSSALIGKTAYRREQLNEITSYVDASMVYGSNKVISVKLRNQTGGLGQLKIGRESSPGKPFLIFDSYSFAECQQPAEEGSERVECFLAGDHRVNEQVGLTCMHNIFVREHNRVAARLAEINPQWSDETLYQEARRIVGAEWQHIVYNEYLPEILGPQGMEVLGRYQGYNDKMDATIINSFATAAFRFGHSQIMPIFPRLNQNWEESEFGHLPLHKAFFSPFRIVNEGGIDPLLRGLVSTPVKQRSGDQPFTSALVERLFEETSQVALDLGALNIQRGRDHGLPGYNAFRQYFGMLPAETFDDLSHEIIQSDVRDTLENLYAHPDNIDLYVGGVIEEVLSGAQLGPVFLRIIAEQFRRLRDGDRFYYENRGSLTPYQLDEIRKTSLAKIICTNADNIRTVPRNVFLLQNTEDFVNCNDLPEPNLEMWRECSSCNSDRSKRSHLFESN